jgi:hypothetical protein
MSAEGATDLQVGRRATMARIAVTRAGWTEARE